ncbi:MAG: HEAT repeat domain-containing protein [Myxococcota bacterium]
MIVGSTWALYLAVVFGLLTAGVLVVFAGRRALTFFLERRLAARVNKIEAILRGHRDAKFKEMDRLLFQLADAHDPEAVELALGGLLAAGQDESRASLEHLYRSLGIAQRHHRDLGSAREWAVRAAAARALGQLRYVEAIPALVKAMRDPHEDSQSVKLAAAQALGQMRVEEAVPLLLAELAVVDEWASPRIAEVLTSFGDAALGALIQALSDETHVNLRVWAAQILGQTMARVAVPDLIARLQDRSSAVRMSAAEALGKIGDKRAANDLVDLARRDPVATVRAEAARALGRVGDETVVENLVVLLEDPDYWTRLRAIEAIELIRPADTSALDRALTDPSAEVRSRAAIALERIGVLTDRVAQLASDDRRLVERARHTLIEMGRAGLSESILFQLESPDFKVRARIVEVLGEIGAKASAAAIAPLVKDPSWPVRAKAVEAIARLYPDDGVELVLPALGDAEETVRAAAIAALDAMGRVDDQRGVVPLVAMFDSSNAEVRASVIAAVGPRNDPAVIDLLRRGLLDPNAEVRLAAVRAVRARASMEWLPDLEARLSDPATEVRVEAAAGLGRLGTQAAIDPLTHSMSTPDRELREALSKVLAEKGVTAIQELLARATSVESVLALVWSLGKTQDPAATPVLVRLASRPDAAIRAAVAGALGKLRGGEAEPVLQGLLLDTDERVRAAAVNAAAQRGLSGLVDALIPMLSDPDAFVRNRVALALGRLGGPRGAETLLARQQAVEPAFWVAGLLATGTEVGHLAALQALRDSGIKRRLEALLRREPEELQVNLRRALSLDEHGATDLGEEDLGARYTNLLSSSASAVERAKAARGLRALGLAPVSLLARSVRSDPDPMVREACLLTLAEGSPFGDEVIRCFLDALKDPLPSVRRAAAQALGRAQDPAHNSPLLSALVGADAALSDALVESLARANQSSARDFSDVLMGASDDAILAGGARVLGSLAHRDGLPLLSQLRTHPRPKVRAAAVDALGRIGTLEAERALFDLVTDAQEMVRLAAVEALARTGDSAGGLERLAKDPSFAVRHAVASTALRPGLALRLLEVEKDDPDERIRRAAYLRLGSLGLAEALLTALSGEVDEVLPRVTAPPFPEETAAGLSKAYEEALRPEARRSVLEVLKAYGQRPTSLLLRALQDPAAPVRIAAAYLAAQATDPDVARGLEALLRDPDPEVRDAVRRGKLTLIG